MYLEGPSVWSGRYQIALYIRLFLGSFEVCPVHQNIHSMKAKALSVCSLLTCIPAPMAAPRAQEILRYLVSEGVPTVVTVAAGENVDTLSVSRHLQLLTSWRFRSRQVLFCFCVFHVFFYFVNKVQFGFLYSQDFLAEGFLLYQLY